METVRVRFAPSPTGYLHVGGARTALFNWLFARHYGGKFILRIEDTDVERSQESSTEAIIESLAWLGLDWDEGPGKDGPYGPYFQSQRIERYKEAAEKLLREGKAYVCYCTPEELARERKAYISEKRTLGYSGRCRNLSAEEVEAFMEEGRRPVVRFKIPDGVTVVSDIIRGEVSFENPTLGDFIIMKSDGFPTYNFAAVVDDALMEMTHIIRAEEHLPNTPKQVLLYSALGYPIPKFAHVPMILGPDRSKLSKRHGATSITQYRDMGYLPEALVNYLALLGWAYDASHELFSQEELIELFSLDRVSKNASIFDPKKLEWMNGYYIRKADPERIAELCIPYLIKGGLLKERPRGRDLAKLLAIVKLLQERMKTIADVVSLGDFFFHTDIEYDREAALKFLERPGIREIFRELRERLSIVEPFTAEAVERVVRSFASEQGLKAGDVIHPTRVALTGKAASPGLFQVIEVLGRETTCRRLEKAMRAIEDFPSP